MTSHSITWVIPVETVAIGWYVALSRVRAGRGNAHVGTLIVDMEFLSLWATIGATIIAEQLMVRLCGWASEHAFPASKRDSELEHPPPLLSPQGRFHVPFIAPVLVTIFTLALHSVGLPFIGNHVSNLSYLSAVKILFAAQLVAAAVVYAAVALGATPEGLEEQVARMQIQLTGMAATLDSHTATLGDHTAQLGGMAAQLGGLADQLSHIIELLLSLKLNNTSTAG